MVYSEQLSHPEWQKRRLYIFERDKFTCRANDCRCKNIKSLHVHHIEYFEGKQAWEYPDELLITLCQDCHAKENSRDGLEKYLATTLKMNGFLVCDLIALSVKLEQDKRFANFLLNILRQYQNG